MSQEIEQLKKQLVELANSYKAIKATLPKTTTTTPAPASNVIKQSVGEGGKNDLADVMLVQKLLNAKYKLGVSEDGKIGPKTIAAIKQFQLKVVKIAKPDGRIDPGGKSWSALSAGAAASTTPPATTTTTPPVATVVPTVGMIKDTVGDSGGKNLPADVALIQTLFNKNHKKSFAIDGKVTPELIAAIRALQTANGSSKPDGRVDPNGKTFTALNGAAPEAPTTGNAGPMVKPNWLKIAEGENGVAEIVGKQHSPRVLEYHATTGGFKDDETPWCSSFVNWVMNKAGQGGTNNAMAMSWAKYGKKLTKPAYGAIAVFSYGGGKGHVGFVVGKKGSNILVLGGNQGNMVKVSSFGTSKVAAYVVPSSYEVPASAYAFGEVDGDFDAADFNSTR
jgi:uncharacterized protein (TIGR02594 family)